MLNPWKVLGVHIKSTPEQIKAAYYAAMRKVHPDAGGTAEASQEVTEAYGILSDKRRAAVCLGAMIIMGFTCPACKGKGYSFKQKGLTEKITTPCAVCSGCGVIPRGK